MQFHISVAALFSPKSSGHEPTERRPQSIQKDKRKVGFNDGFTYVDGSEDIEQMRETFKCIFTALDQEQHFNMMMETVI